MTTLLVRARLLGADDLSFGRNSIVYVNYLGLTKDISQINASHLPILAQNYTVEQLFDGSFGPSIYPNLISTLGSANFGGNTTISGTLGVSGNTTLGGTLRVSSMTVPGMLRNDASGNVTGGSTVAVALADIPTAVITGSAAYGTSATGTDAYSVVLTPAIDAYATGQLLAFTPDTSNIGACSLNVNSKGAVAVKIRVNGVLGDPTSGMIVPNRISYVVYDATGGPCFELLNPAFVASFVQLGGAGLWTSFFTGTLFVSMCGGGAGGDFGGGLGGGAGAAVVRNSYSVSYGDTFAYSVGSAGYGGNDGTASYFGVLTVAGGTHGNSSTTTGEYSLFGIGGSPGGGGAFGHGAGGGGGGGIGSPGIIWLEFL